MCYHLPGPSLRTEGHAAGCLPLLEPPPGALLGWATVPSPRVSSSEMSLLLVLALLPAACGKCPSLGPNTAGLGTTEQKEEEIIQPGWLLAS